MASQDFDATADPRDIVVALSLEPGKAYLMQNADSTATVRVREAATQPDPAARAHLLTPGADVIVKVPDAGSDGVWVWTYDPAGASVILTNAE